jgi:uncharacterized protein (DUF433 family)
VEKNFVSGFLHLLNGLLAFDFVVADNGDDGLPDYTTIEPNKRGGKPCVRGLRITVYEVLEYLVSDMTEDEILDDFPDLTREDLKACIAYAADRERRLMIAPVAA